MTISSRFPKTLAFTTATALHGAAIWGFSTTTTVEVEGSAGAVEAQIGSSFADMVAGTISAAEAQEITEEVPPEMAEANTPEKVTRTVSAEPVNTPESSAEIQTALLSEPVQATEPPQTAQAQPAPDFITPETAAVIEPEADQAPSVTRSLRPKRRSAALEEQAEAPKKVTKPKKKTQSQPRGNAKQNATAGAETGNTEQKSKVAGTGQSNNKATGNAAISNYPGKVMKKISRVPKPRVGKKGTSIVAFTIAPGGGLSTISLARSSGSPRLDQAALRVVQRAAPFPPPPAGARRSFSIKIKGG